MLISSGRQIDAVNLAIQFELTEQFSPVPLLQSYIKEAKKVLPPAKPGNVSPSSPNAQVSSNFSLLIFCLVTVVFLLFTVVLFICGPKKSHSGETIVR